MRKANRASVDEVKNYYMQYAAVNKLQSNFRYETFISVRSITPTPPFMLLLVSRVESLSMTPQSNDSWPPVSPDVGKCAVSGECSAGRPLIPSTCPHATLLPRSPGYVACDNILSHAMEAGSLVKPVTRALTRHDHKTL